MTPFQDAARTLYERGWHPLPLPPRAKAPPPTGTTGAAPHAEVETINAWIAERPNGNVAVRLDTTMVGIDVDAYGDHHGEVTIAALEATYGPLPPTISTTSRGLGASRIMYYRVPSGLILPGQLGDGVDVIQHHHRYAVAPPSQHPDGPLYAWYTAAGVVTDVVPHANEAAELPAAWFALHLRDLTTSAPPLTINQMLAQAATHDDDSIAARMDADYQWHDVLTGDGWRLVRMSASESAWTRPGKAERGISAVLHESDGPLVMFSTAVPMLQQPWAVTRDGNAWAYSMFGYMAATRHGGDRSACAREYRRQINEGTGEWWPLLTSATAVAVIDDTETNNGDPWAHYRKLSLRPWGVDDVDTDEWLAWPLLPAGRLVALHAPAKAGKSWVALAVAASLATGRPTFDRHPIAAPVDVGYMDYEMTAEDVYGRLEVLGYGPDDDALADHLHYCVMPATGGLDTPEGGASLLAWAVHHKVRVVILDTFTRAVQGPENDADTYRNFYRYAGAPLKAAGITVLRLDHTGKDAERGQRGSSSKNEDVDIVWKLTPTDHGAHITATHARVRTAAAIDLHRAEVGNGLMSWRELARMDDAPAGTAALMALLDHLGVADDATVRVTRDALKAHGETAANDTLRAAVRYRKARADVPHRADGTPGTPAHTTDEVCRNDDPARVENSSKTPASDACAEKGPPSLEVGGLFDNGTPPTMPEMPY